MKNFDNPKLGVEIKGLDRVRKAWASFERCSHPVDDEVQQFQSSVMCRFKPLGLMLFGVRQGMTVQCYISTRDQLDIAHYGTLPAMIFGRAHSYEHLQKMLLETETNLNEWADFQVVDVGNIMRVIIKAPRPQMLHDVEVSMWGAAQDI